MSKKKNDELTFEESLKRLEEIVTNLETGSCTLDDGLKKFEEGVSLYKGCRDYLDIAEKKIKVLTEELKEESYTEETDD